tara:strand:- start:142 stop:447 length:306 start_codon:yes stop_codon:yes gene_type:complete
MNAHCLIDTFSFKKKELKSIANGIANCEPIIIGDTIFALFRDIVIKTLAKNPIDNEKQKSGNQYFLSGISNLQNGRRHKKTINILKLPISNGGTESLNTNF